MKLFEDLPSQNTPITAEALNQIQDNLVVVSATEPTGENREKVWIQKGKNLFNGQILAGDQIGQNSTIRLYTRQKIFVKKGSTITFSTNLNTNTYQYLFQLLEKVPGYYLSQTNYTQIFDSGWKAASTFSYTATQDGYIALGFRKADNSALTPSDILGYQYQLEYGTATAFEEYIEPKIYVKNDNDVYEKFISKEDTLEKYSTEEQKIGTWINGKPLYRKTIRKSFVDDWTTLYLNDINVDTIYINYGKTFANFKIDDTYYSNGQFYVDDTDFFRTFIANKNELLVAFASPMTEKMATITIEYTKTTD